MPAVQDSNRSLSFQCLPAEDVTTTHRKGYVHSFRAAVHGHQMDEYIRASGSILYPVVGPNKHDWPCRTRYGLVLGKPAPLNLTLATARETHKEVRFDLIYLEDSFKLPPPLRICQPP